MVLVERDGSAHAVPIDTVSAKTLKGQIAVNVAKEAVVMTDEFPAYNGLASQVARHETVAHSSGEYSRVAPDGHSLFKVAVLTRCIPQTVQPYGTAPATRRP
jgi:transposase-like protein